MCTGGSAKSVKTGVGWSGRRLAGGGIVMGWRGEVGVVGMRGGEGRSMQMRRVRRWMVGAGKRICAWGGGMGWMREREGQT